MVTSPSGVVISMGAAVGAGTDTGLTVTSTPRFFRACSPAAQPDAIAPWAVAPWLIFTIRISHSDFCIFHSVSLGIRVEGFLGLYSHGWGLGFSKRPLGFDFVTTRICSLKVAFCCILCTFLAEPKTSPQGLLIIPIVLNINPNGSSKSRSDPAMSPLTDLINRAAAEAKEQ